MNTSYSEIYQRPASLATDQRISRMVYLPMESSYFRSKTAEQNPWLALSLGNPWIIKSVSVVRLTDSLAAINNLFQVIGGLFNKTFYSEIYGFAIGAKF